MSFFDSIKGLFGFSSAKKKSDTVTEKKVTSPSSSATTTRVTSPSSISYRINESAESATIPCDSSRYANSSVRNSSTVSTTLLSSNRISSRTLTTSRAPPILSRDSKLVFPPYSSPFKTSVTESKKLLPDVQPKATPAIPKLPVRKSPAKSNLPAESKPSTTSSSLIRISSRTSATSKEPAIQSLNTKPIFPPYSSPFKTSETESKNLSNFQPLSKLFSASKASATSPSSNSKPSQTLTTSKESTIQSKPVFTSYTSPFKISETESNKLLDLPKPKTAFSSPPSKPSLPSVMKKKTSSTTPLSITEAIALSTTKTKTVPKDLVLKSKPASPNVKTSTFNSSSSSSKLPSKVENELKIEAAAAKKKPNESRQSKKKTLIDASISRTSTDNSKLDFSGVQIVGKKMATSKVYPFDNVPSQASMPTLPLTFTNQVFQFGLPTSQKPATVSKPLSASSTSSTQLQSATAKPPKASRTKQWQEKQKQKAALTEIKTDSEVPINFVNSTLKVQPKGQVIQPSAAAKVESKQQPPNPASKKQKKKKAWIEKKLANTLAQNGKVFHGKNNYQQNFKKPAAFALPEETLSIENYYKSCNLKCKDGVYIDPSGEQNEFLLGCLIFDEQENASDGPMKSDKVLPKIYLDLLNDARGNKRQLATKLLHRPPYDFEILSKLQKKIITVEDAGKKFEVFNYLQLIEEFLESDEPIAKDAAVTMDNEKSKKFRKLMIAEQQKLPIADRDRLGKAKKDLIMITIPFVKDIIMEEKIRFMCDLYLIPDIDVKRNENSNCVKVKVLKIFPSENKGPTTLIAVLDDYELKKRPKFKGFSDGTYSIFAIPNVMAANEIMKSINRIVGNLDLISKVFPAYSGKAKQIQSDQNQMSNGSGKLKQNESSQNHMYNNASKPKEIQSFQNQMYNKMDALFYNSEKPFNQKQKEAVFSMTRSVNTTFLLFGPPGTGKTYTLVEAIRQLVSPEFRKTSSSDRTILICTPSNFAADNIAEQLIDQKFIAPHEMFRIVSASRDTFKRNIKLDCITQRMTLVDSNEEALCSMYELPHPDLLKEFKIIISTLGSLPRLGFFLEEGHFSHIFVDEAAQAPEMDVWLAVGLFATPSTRLIIAGDPKQLGPVTTCDMLSTNENYGYKKSLLARLVDKNIFKNDPRYLVQLTNNHRSHEEIVKISSELFYENTLVATKPLGHNSLCSLPFLRKFNFPVVFHSVTSGVEETSVETRSKRNLAEVDIIVKYVNRCLSQSIKAKDIGVVSPYKYQAESIRQRLNNREITVETVEKYQGSERRVIIISTVRTTKQLGFMADNLRFNTAITRAKHLLIVVGNNNSLNTQKSWKRFIDYCDENGSLVKDFRDNNHQSIEQRLANIKI